MSLQVLKVFREVISNNRLINTKENEPQGFIFYILHQNCSIDMFK